MRTLQVDWDDLELAFRDHTGARNFLDLSTGEVVTWLDELDERAQLDEYLTYNQRYCPIEPLTAEFSSNVVVEFLNRFTEPTHRTSLLDELSTTGLQTVLNTINAETDLHHSFHRFEQAMIWKRVRRFLARQGIDADGEPPHLDLFPSLLPV